MLQTRLISTEALIELPQTFKTGIFHPSVGFVVHRQEPEWQGAQIGPQKPSSVSSSAE